MDAWSNLILAICVFGLAVVGARSARQDGNWRGFSFAIVILLLFSFFLNRWFGFPFPGAIVSKDGASVAFTIFMAIAMIAGMLAQYLYRHFERPARYRLKWDWGCFIAPIFASPIVFIPLAAAFQSADIDLTKDRTALPRLMLYLVAFENGFFWKEYFDRRRKQVEGAK